MDKTRGFLTIVLIGVVLVNVIQFSSIDSAASSRYRALERSATSRIMTIGLGSTELSDAYGFFVALSEVAPHSRLLLHHSDELPLVTFRELALGFGRAASVEAVDAVRAGTAMMSMEHVLKPRSGTVAASGNGSFGSATGVEWQIVDQECQTSASSPTFVVALGQLAGTMELSATEVCIIPADGN